MGGTLGSGGSRIQRDALDLAVGRIGGRKHLKEHATHTTERHCEMNHAAKAKTTPQEKQNKTKKTSDPK
jgi:hypothetical protein